LASHKGGSSKFYKFDRNYSLFFAIIENPPPSEDAGIGYIDARDIADIAVHQLLADAVAGEKLVLSGPRVVTTRQIAAVLDLGY